MIKESTITALINEQIEGSDKFVVAIKVHPGNKITVAVDALSGIPVSEVVELSRFIENNLDREEEDFELEVSTPGLTEAFKVPEQYQKNIGREVKVKLSHGSVEGTLLEANAEKIVVQTKTKERLEGKKKKVEVINDQEIELDQIIETKVVISFN